MRGALFVALVAAIGNLLQGWDNSTIAGATLYIKREFNLQNQPTLEGLIVAMSLVGGTLVTTVSGPLSDSFGRRPMLIISSIFYSLSSLFMLWAPNVYVLLFARLLDGFGIGLAVTIIPVYISETAPSEVRGQLNTLPQLCCSCGMFVSYCMVFVMSLMSDPSWRLMLGILCLPSLVFVASTVFFLPESPPWLVSKGRMLEAKLVLQGLRGREDVSAELASLVEGLGVGQETSIEEYIIMPANNNTDNRDHIKLYGPEEGLSWVAKPLKKGQGSLGILPRQGSSMRSVPLMDPIVALFDSVHENVPEMGSLLYLNTNSVTSAPENWDEESLRDHEDFGVPSEGDSDGDLQTPLLSRQMTNEEEGTGIGGGWQLAWRLSERTSKDGKKEPELQRVYLHPSSSRPGSILSSHGPEITEEHDCVRAAAALVSRPSFYSKQEHVVGPATAYPSKNILKRPNLTDLFEPGVKRALAVGIGLQILQQVSGINGVLYYAPQILKQAGVAVLLSNLGISSDSASLLISAASSLLMLPCIVLSMKLIDVAGRRWLLLSTIPILVLALLAFILSNIFQIAFVIKATISIASVMIYVSCFVMAFGIIPNILCSEIFPTRVRGLCITICALTYWSGNILVTYSTPVLLEAYGLVGVFSIYAVGCIISWIYVFLKVPETKGMPVEVITEFFALGAKQAAKTG
ncbi:hypothetical protein ACFE04_028168 [Oxalis oulophora]